MLSPFIFISFAIRQFQMNPTKPSFDMIILYSLPGRFFFFARFADNRPVRDTFLAQTISSRVRETLKLLLLHTYGVQEF